MNKAQALDIAITAMFREILREDSEPATVTAFPRCSQCDPLKFPLCQMRGQCQQATAEAPQGPQPRFDFVDDDFCEHNGHMISKVACPVHGPEGTAPAPTAEELDGLTGDDTFEEENPMIARARRLAEQKRRQEGAQRSYPDERGPMDGLGPPEELPPNLVV